MAPGARRWVRSALLALFAVAVLAATAAVWAIGPLRAAGGPMELLAFGPDNRFGSDVQLVADSTSPALRFPLIFGIRNGGARSASVDTVHVSIPGRYRLLDEAGRPIAFLRDDGGPLVRYSFAGDGEPIEPGALPSVVPGADRLFIEPTFAGLSCSTTADGVPVLVPAQPWSPDQLATIDVFYSLDARGARRRTGTLRLTFDRTLIAQRAAPASLNAGPVTMVQDTAVLDTVANAGRAEVLCGEPGAGELLVATAWKTSGDGTVIVLSVRDTPRLRLFDLDADGMIEGEAADADRDGRFESIRSVRYAIPPYLLPWAPPAPPAPPRADTLPPDTARADSTRTTPSPRDTVRVDTVSADTVGGR